MSASARTSRQVAISRLMGDPPSNEVLPPTVPVAHETVNTPINVDASIVGSRGELDSPDMLAVSPLFIGVFRVAVFLLAGGWALFRPPRRRG